MHDPCKRPQPAIRRALPLAAAALAVAIGGWWASQRHPPQPPAASRPRPAPTNAAPARQRDGAPARQRASAPGRPAVRRAAAAAAARAVGAPARSALARGPHHRLLFADAREVARRPAAGRRFAGDLLRLRDDRPRGPLTFNEHTLSAVEAGCDFAAVRRLVASDARLLRLPLDRRRSVVVELDRVLARGPVTHTLLGKVAGDPFSDVLLVFHDGAVSGSLAFLDRDDHYEFGMAGNGNVAIRRLDPQTYQAPCGDPCDHPDAAAAADTADDQPTPADGPAPAPPASDPAAAVVIDTVVGYDPAARVADGGVSGIEARIIAAVDRMNSALSNSQVTGTAVALRATIEDPAYIFPGALAGEIGEDDELGHLDDDDDGVLDTVSDLRRELGADHNAFVITQSDGYSGIARRPGRSMIVARDFMTSTRITFAHEFGHNLDAGHAWGDTAGDLRIDRHSYGWRLDPPGAAAPVRTIMAYDWSWGTGARIPYFSNPAVEYNGARTGAADGYDATGDLTADSRCVAGGLTGGGGTGYDGTHPQLGARNADRIAARAPLLAASASRPAPEIAIECPAGTALVDGGPAVALDSPALGTTTATTFTLRNPGTAPLADVAASIGGPAAPDFAIARPPPATLAAGAVATFEVVFTPSAAGDRTATLHVASTDADENPFDIALLGQTIGRWQFACPQSLTIPAQGAANPWPSAVEVAGVSGRVLSLRVLLNDVSHGYPDDLDVLLVSPAGRVCALMSDVGRSYDLVHVKLVIDDAAPGPLPDSDQTPITSGTYQPTNAVADESLPPGGKGTIGTSLMELAGTGVNGPWRLFVSDDNAGDSGSIGSWAVWIEAAAEPVPVLAVAGPAGALPATGGVADLGPRVVGAGPAWHVFTLSNPGAAPLTAIALRHDGSHAGDFLLDCSATAATLAPGATTTFAVGFAPAATGTRVALAHVTSSDPARNPFDIVLAGTGITALKAYQAWATAAGLGGDAALPAAAPFGDGVANLLKYAFHMDGTAPDRHTLTPGRGASGLPALYHHAADGLPVCRFEFVRRSGSGLAYAPVQSPSLAPAAWLPATGTTTVTTINPDWERVVITQPLDRSVPRRFFSVVVTLPEPPAATPPAN